MKTGRFVSSTVPTNLAPCRTSPKRPKDRARPHLPTDIYLLEETVPVPAKRGDVVCFSIYTIHGSYINTTDKPRRLVRVGYRDPQNLQTAGQSLGRPGLMVPVIGIDGMVRNYSSKTKSLSLMSQPHPWVKEAVQKIEADFNRSADTHLIRLDIPGLPQIQLYLKDELTHPTGSLKHRLARSLFLYALCNGWIKEDTTIIEASSGSTAISEAYFARLLGLPFIAVIPEQTSPAKIAQIKFYGGQCYLVDNPSQVYTASHRLAQESGGHFMDQFTYAERATDWRGNNNIAEFIFQQMAREPHPEPSWIICGAGTGGTSATIGRFIHYRCFNTRLGVVDPENSVFYDFYQTGNPGLTSVEWLQH